MFDTALVVCFIISGALCVQEQVQADHESELKSHEHDTALDNHVAPLEKRSPHYNFGLGKRAYSYVSEYKRLPVYNFGLGKRSRPYSFGLGKRSINDESQEEITNEIDNGPMSDTIDEIYDEIPGYEVKRARPYSFGLGKRATEDEEPEEEKRARMYDFGLGKRPHLYSFGLGKRARGYDFGLGKRWNNKFSFGLGKRQRDLHRFSFGLGKRSVDVPFDDNENYLDV